MAADLFALPIPSEDSLPPLNLQPVELLKQGWEFIKPQYINFMLMLIAMSVASYIVSKIPLGFAFSFLVTTVFSSGILYYLVKAYQGDQPTLNSVIEPIQKKPGEIIIVSVIQTVLTVVGFFLLIIPGLYFALVLTFALPLVVFTASQPLDAIFLSRRIIHRQFGEWVFFSVVIIVVNILALLPFGLGLLVSLPATAGAFTIVLARLFGVAAGHPVATTSP